jgi:hypothetical protein
VSANYAVTLRNFDSTPFPSRGWGVGLSVGGGATLGSQTDPYARVVAHGLTYLPLDRGTQRSAMTQPAGRLALRAELNAVLAKKGIALPSTQLFLTGGDNSVRGYTFRDIGVVRANGLVAPGRYLARPAWSGAPHPRGGPDERLGEHWPLTQARCDHVSELRPKVGAGVLESPVGPLQIDPPTASSQTAALCQNGVGFEGRVQPDTLAAALLTVLVMVGGVWVWGGSSSSLNMALARAAGYLPADQTLEVTDATGSLRQGGHIARLRWTRGALSVEAVDVDIAWSLLPLWDGELRLGKLVCGD